MNGKPIPTPRPKKPGAGCRRRCINEGRKVQTDWLHDFLLDPYLIRPAVVLRMPKFNMSTGEATALANYFAAVDNVELSVSVRPAHAARAIWLRPRTTIRSWTMR